MKLNTYLNFNGNCEEAFKFYEKVLGGKIEMMMPFEGSPSAKDVPSDWGKKILHVNMTVGDSLLMGSDAPPQYSSKPAGFAVNIGINDYAKAERIFKQLSEGGKITMPFQNTFWAQGFGMFVDRYGTPWMINCE